MAQALQAHARGRPGDPRRASRRRCATGPLTREELAERVHPGLAPRLRRPAQAGRVPRRADLRAEDQTSLRAARSRSSRMDTEEATREVARRFLTRYGPAHPRGAREVVRAARRPPQAGRWIKALGDEVVETEFGWALDARRRRRSRPRSRPASSGCCPRSTSTSSPRRATTRATTRAGAHLPPRRLVLARAARRRRDGGRLERARATRSRSSRSRRSARPVREAAEAEAARLPGAPASAGRANLRGTPPLVTISASYGAGGSQVGPAVAERLGVEFLDRAIPTRVADRLAVPLDDALAHDESLGDAIGRLVSSFALLPELAGAMVQAGVAGGRGLPARDREADPRARATAAP